MAKSKAKQPRQKLTRAKLKSRVHRYRWFYLMALPAIVCAILFHYFPMIGIRYAFTNYNGINPKPAFVGLENFKKMFENQAFLNAFRNTVEISLLKMVMQVAFAVVISILLNEISNIHLKKLAQTVIYLPHFLSWVVTASIFTLVLSPTPRGLINNFLVNIGVINSDQMIYFLGKNDTWRPVYYTINLWKETGWQTVLFMATLAGVNVELYEAASIDGAGRWGKMRYVTFPALSNTILTVFILNLAKIMNLFESVFVLQNDAVLQTSNVIETYIYYRAFNSGGIPNYGFTTAVGLFKSLVGMILVLVCNEWSKKVRDGRGIV